MKTTRRARLEIILNNAKKTKMLRADRNYDPVLGGWIENALSQHSAKPFHAIIAQENSSAHGAIVLGEEADELHPLMVSPHTWQVHRVGSVLADAMGPMLRSARTLLFVDRFFDVRDSRYQETLKACLDAVHSSGANGVRCEIRLAGEAWG